jgi:hypothetical protein
MRGDIERTLIGAPAAMIYSASMEKCLAMASLSVELVFFLVYAEHARSRPAIFRRIVDHNVQMIGLAASMLHHRIGDGLRQFPFLFNGSTFPHFDDNKGHHTPR